MLVIFVGVIVKVFELFIDGLVLMGVRVGVIGGMVVCGGGLLFVSVLMIEFSLKKNGDCSMKFVVMF